MVAAKNQGTVGGGSAFLRGYETDSRPIYVVRPEGLGAFLNGLPTAQGGFVRDSGFEAKSGELVLLPGDDGVSAAALGLGEDRSPSPFGALAFRLPLGRSWRFAPRRL